MAHFVSHLLGLHLQSASVMLPPMNQGVQGHHKLSPRIQIGNVGLNQLYWLCVHSYAIALEIGFPERIGVAFGGSFAH